jgi:O-antigen/teichoic acid export membrane protein
VTKYFIIFLGFITLVTALFSKEIIFVLAADSYHKAYSIIPLIAVGSFFMGIYFLPSKIFFYQKKTYISSLMTVIAAIVNIVMNIILIPRLGIIGAAISTVLSYLIITTIVFYYSQKRYKIHYQLPKIIISLVIFIILYLISIILEEKYLTNILHMMTILKILLVVAIYPIFRAFKIITTDDISEIKNIIIKRK